MGEHNGGVSTSSVMRTAHHRGMPPPLPPTRPKIKIIHIIAPEIIKTDVAHFRDLVQRLTGKPACATSIISSADDTAPVGEEEQMEMTTKKRPRPALAPAPVAEDEMTDFKVQDEEPIKKRMKIKCEVKMEEGGGFGDYDLDRSSDMWMDLNPGGFLSFLEEEGVFQGLAAEHDFLQPAFGSSRMDLVGEMYAS